MKTIFYLPIVALSLTFVALSLTFITSCEKYVGGKDYRNDDANYVAVDFEDSDYFVHGHEMEHVKSINIYFYYTKGKDEKESRYKLVVDFIEEITPGEFDSKNLSIELGSCEIDKEMNITFYPEGDEILIRYGWFENNKSILWLSDKDIHSPNGFRFLLKK
ncbi:hypothetical protein JYT74_03775 [Crocinitomix catalasitica]|nr:hypothetical protein [Crocinitomix catalasitica]